MGYNQGIGRSVKPLLLASSARYPTTRKMKQSHGEATSLEN